jgi:hypothetical protein
MLRWIIAISLLISAAIAGFFYWEIQKNEGELPSYAPLRTTTVGEEVITIHHAFQDGVHKFSGRIRLPHSCYAVDPVITKDKAEPSKMLMTLHIEDHMLDLKVCVQLPTTYEFETIAEGDRAITLSLNIGGKNRPIVLNEVPWQLINEGIKTK